MSKEQVLMKIITLHHLFLGHCVNLSMIALDLGTFFRELHSINNNHLRFHTMTSKKIVRSYYCLNNCLCHRNLFKNGVNIFSNMVNHFLPKSTNLMHFLPYDFVQISPIWSKYLSSNVWRDYSLPMSASVMVT